MQGRDLGGFASGSGSDVKQPQRYKGVMDRRVVEIMPLLEDAHFIYDVTGMSTQQAAMAHDLACVYANPNYFDIHQLNLQALVEDVALAIPLFGAALSTRELMEFLINFVRKHPLQEVGANPKEWVDSVKEDVVALAPSAFQALQEWMIKKVYEAGAGFRRQDEDELFPALEGVCLLEPLESSELNADDAEVFNLKALMLMVLAPPGAPEPESNLTDLNKFLLKEIQRLEALSEVKDAKIASLSKGC